MTDANDANNPALPISVYRGIAHTFGLSVGAQRAAAEELADVNRELFKDVIEAMHSISLLSNEFWHARTIDAATKAVEEFALRQERIWRRENHRWAEHCHRVFHGALHATAQKSEEGCR